MLILLAIFLLLLNGFFVAAEFALVKVRGTQLEPLVNQGSSSAKLASHIVKNIDPYLSATQLGITLASLGLGWIGEPAVASLLKAGMLHLGINNPNYIHTASFIIAFTIISFLHIVIGEIAPKSFALAQPVATSMFVSYPMKITYFIFYPALMLLNGTSNLLLKAVGITPANGHTSISAEELYHMTRQSGASGAIDTDQSQLLTNVFTFSDRVASEIMVPHNRVVYVDVDATIDEILQLVLTSGHSRIPLVEESLDKVIGVLHIKDLLPHISNNTVPDDIRKLARTPIFVSEFMPAQKILVELKHQRTHLAIVVDEYGGTSGVVTIEDVLEELVGDIQDEFDTEVQVIQKSDNGYIIDGSASLFEVFRTLNLGEPDSDADTLNGFMMEYLEHIPVVNDTLTIDGWQFKVLSMDGLRIGKLEAIRLEQETESK